ncbi:phosphodiesterase, partial [Elysia marginata]
MPVSPRVEAPSPSIHSGYSNLSASSKSRFPPLRSPLVIHRELSKEREQTSALDNRISLYNQMSQRPNRHAYVQRGTPGNQLHPHQLLQPSGGESRLSDVHSRDNKSSSSHRLQAASPQAKGYAAGGELTLRVTTLSPYAYSIYTNAVDSNTTNGNIMEGAFQRSLRNIYSNNNSSNSYLINRNFSYFGLSATGTPVLTAPTATSALRPRKTSSRLRFMQHQQQQQQQQQQQHLQQGKLKSRTKKSQQPRSQINVDDLSQELVTEYLRLNPQVLDQIVSSDLVHTDRLKQWLHRKSLQSHEHAQFHDHGVLGEATDMSLAPGSGHGSNSLLHLPQPGRAVENGDHSSDSSLVLSKWKTKIQMSKRKVLHELSKDFHHISGKVRVLLELADCVAAAVSADSFTLHSFDALRQELTQLCKNDGGEVEYGAKESVTSRASVASSTAFTKEPVRLKDLRINQHASESLSVSSTRAHSVMALPILDDQNTCFGVVELHRHTENSQFSDKEEEVGLLMLQWFDMLLDYVERNPYLTFIRHRVSRRLVEAYKIRSIFQDIVSMDVVIMKIMNFAQTLVVADRASLFLVDSFKHELYARIFDVGHEHKNAEKSPGAGGQQNGQEI